MKDIKKSRKICKVTQKEMADLLGLDQGNYCNIENGRLIPKNISDIKERAATILYPKLRGVLAVKLNELLEIDKLCSTIEPTYLHCDA